MMSDHAVAKARDTRPVIVGGHCRPSFWQPTMSAPLTPGLTVSANIDWSCVAGLNDICRPSICLSVHYTREPRPNASSYRNISQSYNGVMFIVYWCHISHSWVLGFNPNGCIR